MRHLFLIAFGLIYFAAGSTAEEKARDVRLDAANTAAVAAGSFLKQALGRADIAIGSSRIPMKHLQGAFGEQFTGSYFNQGAKWQQVRHTVGRTGIDLLHLKIGEGGRIEGMTVSEVKTGSSKLGTTKDGRQMGTRWTSRRLKTQATRARELGRLLERGEIVRSRPSSVAKMKHTLDVPLGPDESATFWREGSKMPWKLDATAEQANRIPKQLEQMAQYLDGAGDGRISYRNRLFRVTTEGKELVLKVLDAKGIENGIPESKLPVLHTRRYPIKGGGAIGQSLTAAFSKELERLHPELGHKEINARARDLSQDLLQRDLNFRNKGWSATLRSRTLLGGAIGVASSSLIELGIGLVSDDGIDLERFGSSAMAGGLGFAVGELSGGATTHLLLNSRIGASLTSQVASSMGLASSSYAANLMGSAVGGGAAAAVFSYVLLFSGYVDLETANRMAVAGVAGSLAGAASSALITSLVASYATAGTGVAISSLSGAAATSATLAAVGGGSMAVGSALIWTGAGAVVVAVGAGVMWGFTLYDEAEENERLILTYEYLAPHFASELE